MGRRKIEIKPIKDDRNRSVTFLKRKGGLFKKAHELSVLCQVDVAVVIFGTNKKLHQYCSGDINEMISRHGYYEMPHESKGPADFAGKNKLDEEDDDDFVAGPDRAGSHSSDHQMMPYMAAQLQNRQPTQSASPPNVPRPMMAGFPMHGRMGTPQPVSRPSSRNQLGGGVRRNSSNLVPQNGYAMSQGPATSTYYAPQVYSTAPQMPMQPANINQMQSYQFPTSQPQTQAQAQAEAFINETRRQSMPPAFNGNVDRAMSHSENSPPPPQPQQDDTPQVKRAPAKSRSMFTPIDSRDSMLAMHFGMSTSDSRAHSVDVGAVQRKNAAAAPPAIKTEDRPELSPKSSLTQQPTPNSADTPSAPSISRTNSLTDPPKSGGQRPRLTLNIPAETEDTGSATEESPRDSSGTTAGRSNQDGQSGTGIVLPAPSPSVQTALSAGATGPPNPFSRPPISSAQDPTPISALPSRFTENMMPSPSAFYSDWSLPLPRTGPDFNPSPLTYTAPSRDVKDQVESTQNGKRKSPESDAAEPAQGPKRVKT